MRRGGTGPAEAVLDDDVLRALLGDDVRVRAAIEALAVLLGRARFPIADLDDLLRAVPKKGLRHGPFAMGREEVAAFAHPAVFPIESRERLIALVAQAVRQLEPPRHRRVSFEELLTPPRRLDEDCG